jgi:hypothetical protein
MAIKGKRKGKARSGRVVTPGPRPAYVPPRIPPFQRTGAKFLVALILEAVLFSLAVGFGEQSEADRQAERIDQVTSLVQASLSRGGAAIQAFPTGASVLPELGTRLSELTAEEPPKSEDVATETEAWSSAVTRAAEGVAGVQVPSEDLDPQQRLALTEARNLIERSLRLYAGLADQVAVAAQIEGDAQRALIESIQQQIAVAGEMFSAGFGKIQEVRARAGLSTAPTTSGVPGLTPPGLPDFPIQSVPAPEEPPADTGGGGGKGGKGGGGGNGGGGGG